MMSDELQAGSPQDGKETEESAGLSPKEAALQHELKEAPQDTGNIEKAAAEEPEAVDAKPQADEKAEDKKAEDEKAEDEKAEDEKAEDEKAEDKTAKDKKDDEGGESIEAQEKKEGEEDLQQEKEDDSQKNDSQAAHNKKVDGQRENEQAQGTQDTNHAGESVEAPSREHKKETMESLVEAKEEAQAGQDKQPNASWGDDGLAATGENLMAVTATGGNRCHRLSQFEVL